MRFRFGRGGSRVPIGCGALLTLLGLILLTLSFAVNFLLTQIQQREQIRWLKHS